MSAAHMENELSESSCFRGRSLFHRFVPCSYLVSQDALGERKKDVFLKQKRFFKNQFFFRISACFLSLSGMKEPHFEALNERGKDDSVNYIFNISA